MNSANTKTVELSSDQAFFVDQSVREGRYPSANEVVRAGLELLQQQEQTRIDGIQKARRLIQEGADQIDRGQWIEGQTYMKSRVEKYQKMLDALGESA